MDFDEDSEINGLCGVGIRSAPSVLIVNEPTLAKRQCLIKLSEMDGDVNERQEWIRSSVTDTIARVKTQVTDPIANRLVDRVPTRFFIDSGDSTNDRRISDGRIGVIISKLEQGRHGRTKQTS